MSEKFIRIDMKGSWRGKEHKSAFGDRDWTNTEEEGVSCYSFENPVQGLEDLYDYWVIRVARCEIDDFKNMQITVFEGELLPECGSDGEELATCERTLLETEAYPIMKAIYDAREDCDIDYNPSAEQEDQYEEVLRGLIAL